MKHKSNMVQGTLFTITHTIGITPSRPRCNCRSCQRIRQRPVSTSQHNSRRTRGVKKSRQPIRNVKNNAKSGTRAKTGDTVRKTDPIKKENAPTPKEPQVGTSAQAIAKENASKSFKKHNAAATKAPPEKNNEDLGCKRCTSLEEMATKLTNNLLNSRNTSRLTISLRETPNGLIVKVSGEGAPNAVKIKEGKLNLVLATDEVVDWDKIF